MVYHIQMNDILEHDYEKKVILVALLRQYAEDRDVRKFAESIDVVLRTEAERRIITEIR